MRSQLALSTVTMRILGEAKELGLGPSLSVLLFKGLGLTDLKKPNSRAHRADHLPRCSVAIGRDTYRRYNTAHMALLGHWLNMTSERGDQISCDSLRSKVK